LRVMEVPDWGGVFGARVEAAMMRRP